jgi:hypothetical protein
MAPEQAAMAFLDLETGFLPPAPLLLPEAALASARSSAASTANGAAIFDMLLRDDE